MRDQPFDYYKNKDVEYDVILNADVNLDNVSYNYITEIIKLLNNEDLLAMYFKDIALGRVYGKVEAVKNGLHFTFGISFIDTEKRPTSKDLLKDLKAFILSLNKNIEDAQINIKEGDVKVDILSENKNIYDNIDKVLVNENNLYFSRGNDIQSLKLTDDGIVEKYLNENLQETFPFSKLGITRECKTLITNGYSLTKLNEATITSNNTDNDTQLDLSNPEKTKQDLQQNINDVEEIQNLKNELDNKIDNLMEENKKPEEPFPSSDFTNEPMDYSDIDVGIFNDNLTNEQKAYINTYIGTIDELVNAMLLLYEEVGDTMYPMISLDDYIKEILEYDGGITEWSQELSDMLGFDLKTEKKDDTLSYGDLEDLAKDIYDWFDSDMGTHFDEIQNNEEETYGDIMTVLETKDQEQIQNFINTIKEADIDDETAKKINIATTSSLLNRLNTLLKNKKQEGKSKFYTADKMFDDFLKTAKEEAEEGGYTFKLSDLGLTKEASVDFKNLLLQRDEIEDVSYDPKNNTYTVKVTGVENVEKPDDNDSDEK